MKTNKSKESIESTGEFLVIDKVSNRIKRDHFERYKFASKYVKGRSVLDIACGIGYGSKFLMDGGA